ncbi:MAG: SURF1 family protein [Anaerolineae bacterium]|nr:SURF1 family protein [Anaerolineae bacterium]MBL8105154.1 SURF1 family protein [Anaerolineales bacterium]MCC7188296.1 SURF1 family protein [Anaerolineales bacterium]
MLLRRMFSRAWRLTTLLVFAGTLVLIRLGIWQLDRLETRRADNAHYLEMRSNDRIDLNVEIPEALGEMKDRAATVTGNYDFENQVAMRNQERLGQYGYHLFTPLRFDGMAVLVDRGWIPADGNDTPDDWRKYDETGPVVVEGWIQPGHGKPAFGGIPDALPQDGSPLEFWINPDVANIARQLPYPILPVYLQLAAVANDTTPPIAPAQAEKDLTEGSHFGYAMQWFTFAALLFFGYPYFIKKQDSLSA